VGRFLVLVATRAGGSGQGESDLGRQLAKVSSVGGAGDAALSIVRSEYPNYHPLIALARLAHREDVISDPKLELEVHRTILPYVTPKLSSAEVRVANDDDRRVIVSLFEERRLESGRVVEVEVPLVRDVTDLVPLD
jgi:hypothetical protein